jgi:CRISPR-associated endoribonuclease Cas6
LQFASPTAFETENGNALFPMANQVFAESLGRKWNEHAPEKLPPGLLGELAQQTRVERFSLWTEAVRFRGDRSRPFVEKGFVGECEFSVGPRGSPEAQRALHLLADFAFFAGVGKRTTLGMGQARPVAESVPPGKERC